MTRALVGGGVAQDLFSGTACLAPVWGLDQGQSVPGGTWDLSVVPPE